MYDSSQIDPNLVRDFKEVYRGDLKFTMTVAERLALAEAFRQLSIEFFSEAANMDNMPNISNANTNVQPEQTVRGEAGRIQQ